MEKNFIEIFSLKFQKDDLGEIFEEDVYDRFVNNENIKLHGYGQGPFCRFSIDEHWKDKSGVFAFVVEGKPLYIGSTVNLHRIINSDIGRISPSSCYIGGQSTNCRINHSILNQIKKGKNVTLSFYEAFNTKDLKAELINKYKPVWNLR